MSETEGKSGETDGGLRCNDGLGEVTKTGRGFQIVNFDDHNGQLCSLQQSSLAEYEPPGTSVLWLGVGDSRMHLTLEQVKRLVSRLQKWVEDGVLA